MQACGLIALTFLVAFSSPPPTNGKAVDEAVKWLARHQDKDGGWSVGGYTANCDGKGEKCAPNPGDGNFDTGVTSLALLAMIRSGYGVHSDAVIDGVAIGDSVRRGVGRLITVQDKDGCVGTRTGHQYMYNHAVATYALAEAVRTLDGAGDLNKEGESLRIATRKAVDYLLGAQNQGMGWRYGYKSGDSDTSVTTWAVTALASARKAGIEVPAKAFQDAIAWFDKASDPKSRKTGYTHRGTGKVFIPGKNEKFDHHETMTAAACLGRILHDPRAKKNEWVKKGVELVLIDLPDWDDNAIDFYYWYYVTTFLAHYQTKLPRAWSKGIRKALEENQNGKSGVCKEGSWEPAGRWCVEGGRVYATALNTLTLGTVHGLPGKKRATAKKKPAPKKPGGDRAARWIKSKLSLARNYHNSRMDERASAVLKSIIKKYPEHAETGKARKLLEEWK